MSSNCNTVAVFSRCNGDYSAYTCAFACSSHSKKYNQLGDSFAGMSKANYFGYYFSVNSDGKTVSTVTTCKNDNSSSSGNASTFACYFETKKWNKLGN